MGVSILLEHIMFNFLMYLSIKAWTGGNGGGLNGGNGRANNGAGGAAQTGAGWTAEGARPG